MLRKILFGFGVVILFSCNWNQDYFRQSYELNREYKSNIGDVLYFIDNGIYNTPNKFILKGSRQELVYNGIQDSTINIIYREYYYDRGSLYIKDGFTQNLHYDLSKDSEIVFRNIIIKVLEANNKFINFVIIKD